MTTWNQRKHKHHHGDMVHAHINGYTNHEHDDAGRYIDTDRDERLAHEALGDREKQRQADANRDRLLGLR